MLGLLSPTTTLLQLYTTSWFYYYWLAGRVEIPHQIWLKLLSFFVPPQDRRTVKNPLKIRGSDPGILQNTVPGHNNRTQLIIWKIKYFLTVQPRKNLFFYSAACGENIFFWRKSFVWVQEREIQLYIYVELDL